jgi:hypothetical protein
MTELERQAERWIAGYHQYEHLARARAYVLVLDPDASRAQRLAALTHDIERHFPGSPVQHKHIDGAFEDPDYLFAHSTRSADIVESWLRGQTPEPAADLVREVRKLILLHELGGGYAADLVQAADSLSYLETNGELTAGWVRDGECSAEQARAKLRWMRDRVRIDRATDLAEPLYRNALALVDAAGHMRCGL